MESKDRTPRQQEPAEERAQENDPRKERASPEEQKFEGKLEEWKGRAKQAGGAITGDTGTKAEGQVDELKGKAKQKIGDLREEIRKKI